VLIVQILNDGLDDFGGEVEVAGETFGDDLALEHEFVAVAGVDARIIACTY
jgi:hypothetical protein